MGVVLFLCAVVAADTASAQRIVYDNTGGTAPLAGGLTLYGTDQSLYSKAAAYFVAPFDFTLDSVQVGISQGSGGTQVTASLYLDDSNRPGTFLGSASISSVEPGGEFHSQLHTFDFANLYSFTAGQGIWVSITNTTGYIYWGQNDAGFPGIQNQSFNPDPSVWNPGTLQTQQVSLVVSAIPEPSSYVLSIGVFAFAAAAILRRRVSAL